MRARTSGFTLTELAVVMAIVALLLGGLLYTLSAQTDQRNFEETRRRLELARELVLSFAITHGRLPCPARSVATAAPVTVAGDEVLTAMGTIGCLGDTVTDFYGGTNAGVTYGLLPARSVGYQQVDSSGFAVDAWGNRIRYAVAGSTPSCASPAMPHFFNAANLKQNGIGCAPAPTDLLICKSATGITSTTCGPASNQIMNPGLLVVVIYSVGKNGASGATGADEAANLHATSVGDPIFVFHTPTPNTAANGEFDDQFTWITSGELYGKLIAAGVLP